MEEGGSSGDTASWTKLRFMLEMNNQELDGLDVEGEGHKEEEGMTLRFLTSTVKSLMMLFTDTGKVEAGGNGSSALGITMLR